MNNSFAALEFYQIAIQVIEFKTINQKVHSHHLPDAAQHSKL